MKKRMISILLCVAVILSMVGCTKTGPQPEQTMQTTQPQETAEKTEASMPPETTAETVPEEEILSEYEIGYMAYDVKRTGKVQIHSYKVRETEETLRFTMEYTAEPGMEIEGWSEINGGSELLWEKGRLTEGGRDVLEFEIGKASVLPDGYLGVAFMSGKGEDVNIGIEFPARIRMTMGNPEEELDRPGISLQKKWPSDQYQLHDCYTQRLDNGYIRYALDLSLRDQSYVTGFVIERGGNAETVFQGIAPGGRGQYVFDIPWEKIMGSKEVTFLICEEKTRYENLITIPSAHLTALTGGEAVTEAEEVETYVMADGKLYQFHSAAVQTLDNGHKRFALEYSVPENTRCGIFDPPDGKIVSFSWISGAEGEKQKFIFDVSEEILKEITDLTFFAENFQRLSVTIKTGSYTEDEA